MGVSLRFITFGISAWLALMQPRFAFGSTSVALQNQNKQVLELLYISLLFRLMSHQAEQSEMKEARLLLRKILPWAIPSNANQSQLRNNHKGARGRIGIVGGARDYAGAPYFAAISAMRLGADLSYVVCSKEASQSIKSYSPELIVMPILDCSDELLFSNEIDNLLNRLHAIVVGPGLGRQELLQRRAAILIEKAKSKSLPIILDADSIQLVCDNPSIIKSYQKALLTPNRNELLRLSKSVLKRPEIFDIRNFTDQEVVEIVQECSKELQVTILAKGPADIITDGSDLKLTDRSMGSNRRCGGQGDILSGIAGIYTHWIEQAKSDKILDLNESTAFMAAKLASITTRKCNELAYNTYKNGMLASHMIDQLHVVLEQFLEQDQNSSSRPGLNHIEYAGLMKKDEILRYSRQMIMDEFGPARQLKLKQSSCLVVGAGGLGCPISIYLAAAGIGKIGIVDDDVVEVNNLHRQIGHNIHRMGWLKTESLKKSICDINPNLKVDTHSVRLSQHNAVDLVEKYDFVIDASDNMPTRYMISDACVVAKKPLISGAALKMDGQLTVYNYDEDTPCFRCLFPKPMPPGSVSSCSQNGVLGVIPGVIGLQQALEAIKIGAGLRPAYAGSMLIFDGQEGRFRCLTLGKRKSECPSCGPESTLDRNLIDYEEFCGSPACEMSNSAPSQASSDHDSSLRITPEEYLDILEARTPHLLIDVRPKLNSDISRFAHALQMPLASLREQPAQCLLLLEQQLDAKKTNLILVICRMGISSIPSAALIRKLLDQHGNCDVLVKDIIGGTTTWARRIDPDRYASV